MVRTGRIQLTRKTATYMAAYCIIRQELQGLLPHLSSWLHPREIEAFNKIEFDAARKNYLLGRYTAKKAIVKLTDKPHSESSIVIDSGVFEFPVIKSDFTPNVQLSLTHCDNTGIAIAFPEEHPVTIDLEKSGSQKNDLIKNQLNEGDVELAVSSGNLGTNEANALLWTIKESFSKMLKTGLTLDLKLIRLDSIKKTGRTYTSSFSDFTQYKAMSSFYEDYVCSFVLPKNSDADLTQFWADFNAVHKK